MVLVVLYASSGRHRSIDNGLLSIDIFVHCYSHRLTIKKLFPTDQQNQIRYTFQWRQRCKLLYRSRYCRGKFDYKSKHATFGEHSMLHWLCNSLTNIFCEYAWKYDKFWHSPILKVRSFLGPWNIRLWNIIIFIFNCIIFSLHFTYKWFVK